MAKVLVAVAVVAGLAAAAVAALLLAGDDAAAPPATIAPAVRTAPTRVPAPKLAGTDPVTGRTVRLAAFARRPVVVTVWASWCPPCAEQAEAFARFAHDHPEAVVLGIDYQDTVPEARAFYRRWGWRHPTIFDPDGELTARLGLERLPTTFFLDRRHRIAGRIEGPAGVAALERGFSRARRG